MTKKYQIVTLALTAALVACEKKEAEIRAGSPGSGATIIGSGSGSAGSADIDSASGSALAMPARAAKATIISGFSTPESVLYDGANDRYLVSNVNGSPVDVDGNGFISTVKPDGKIDVLRWIDKLDAPKGLAISGDLLYVADITKVRLFELKTGASKGEVKIDHATFLNDVTVAQDGGVFVSDTGVDAKFEPSGADAIWKIGKDQKTTVLIKEQDLGGPNGIVRVGDNVWCVTLRSGEIYAVDAKGKKHAVQKLPKGMLDGIVALDDGSFLVSSWESASIYQGKGADWQVVAQNLKAPADIGWDSKRRRILVPLFQDNQVVLVELSPRGDGAEPR